MSKPHSHLAGYKTSRRSGKNRGWVVVYDTREQYMDTGTRWAVVCETHKTMVGCTSLPRARVAMLAPGEWCDSCCEEPEAAR